MKVKALFTEKLKVKGSDDYTYDNSTTTYSVHSTVEGNIKYLEEQIIHIYRVSSKERCIRANMPFHKFHNLHRVNTLTQFFHWSGIPCAHCNSLKCIQNFSAKHLQFNIYVLDAKQVI